eukprot:7472283-Pyramimonas_sp.AAC.1
MHIEALSSRRSQRDILTFSSKRNRRSVWCPSPDGHCAHASRNPCMCRTKAARKHDRHGWGRQVAQGFSTHLAP